ncbi:hypothetical protein SCHPADRAFT_935569 [Schizopora paradoxa]|uniref:DUF6534 domain-containing protein n=1 Tax=Schizopora paradoxa TaxID=27342 RepID=A0A0H2S5K3_9AGAM|nr:hypothetical protein SCHPADRAFT_935569 [Schizopora paradoxa]
MASVQALPAFDNTLGAVLIGTYVALALYGIVVHQTYRYFRLYPRDQIFVKFSVTAMFILDSFQSACLIYTVYYYISQNYQNNAALENSIWSMRLDVVTTGLVSSVSHAFFSIRIYQFSHNRLIMLVVTAVSTARLGFAAAVTVIGFTTVTFAKFEPFAWLYCLALGLLIVSDILVTASLCLLLQRSRTGFSRTNSIIDKLLVYLINTGLLTALFNCAVLICAVLLRTSLVYIGLFNLVSKLYSNSLMAVVNSRHSLVHDASDGSFELQEVIGHVDVNEVEGPVLRLGAVNGITSMVLEPSIAESEFEQKKSQLGSHSPAAVHFPLDIKSEQV